MIPFYKYQGTGNDFVMIDERSHSYGLSQELIEKMCDRRFGIGADGLILLQNDEIHDFKMIYHNADGREGSLCGNGGRCTVKFAYDLGMISSETVFNAVDGLHKAIVLQNGHVKLEMASIERIESRNGLPFCDTGSPHVVHFTNDVTKINVQDQGSSIRNSDYWLARNGTNVNFVQVTGQNAIKVRTFERGVEAETYSCGTGVTAAALVSNQEYKTTSPLQVETLGGNLQVHFRPRANGSFSDIWLEGPAEKVFEGTF